MADQQHHQTAFECNRNMVSKFYKALASRDTTTVHRLLAPNIEWWFHGPPSCNYLMRLLSKGTSDRDNSFGFNPISIVSIGSVVLAEGYFPGSFEVSWVHAWTVTEGVITQLREYFNTSVMVTRFAKSANGHVGSQGVDKSHSVFGRASLLIDGDLGTISLGILYTSFAVSSLFAASVVRKLGSKNALLMSTTGYWLYIAANLKPSWYTIVPASLYLGFAAASLWVAEGTYLTSAARSHANDHKLHEGTVIGHFNGEFWGIFAFHQVVGNLMTLALLKDGAEGSTSGTTLLFTVFLGSMTLGTVLMSFLKKKDGEETEGEKDSSLGSYTLLVSLWEQVMTPLCDMRMLLIVPLIAFSGLQQAFVWAEFTKYYVQPSLGESGVGGAMAVYGLFDAICSLAAGRFTTGLPSITLIVSGGAFLEGVILIWLLNYSEPTGVLRILYPLLIAAILGIGNGVFMTQLNALLGMLFKHNMEGTFAQLKLWQCASIAVVFFLSPYISLQTMLFLMLAALVLSLAGFLYLLLRVEKVFSNLVL